MKIKTIAMAAQCALLAEVVTLQPKNNKEISKKLLALLLKFNDKELSQTEAHLWKHYKKKHKQLRKGGDLDYSSPRLKQMAEHVIQLEKQEQAKGRYTFVHGQPWHFDLLIDLYTHLWQIKTGQTIDPVHPYKFMRFFELPDELALQHHQIKRTSLVDQGNISDGWYDGAYIAFMNYAFFVNQWGSNTAQYIKNSSSSGVSYEKINLRTVLTALGYDYLLMVYEEELEELQRLHIQANEYGNGLLLSFTPKMLNKCTFAAHGGATKRHVNIKVIGETQDVQTILDTLRTAPWKIYDSNSIEFCLILTSDCALKPNNGLDVYSFNAADPQKYEKYIKARDALLEKIKYTLSTERGLSIKNKWAQLHYHVTSLFGYNKY